MVYYKQARRGMARKEFCEKDGILITYTDNDVCFEDCKTAESILLSNDGTVIQQRSVRLILWRPPDAPVY